jgi:hypothetical protein
VYVPSSELGLPHPFSRKRVCPPPRTKGWGAHSPAAKGVGEFQFQRLEKRLALCLLCAEKDNNGYVVFKCNFPRIILKIAGLGWDRGSHYSVSFHPFLQKASGQIFKDDVNGFSSNTDICFMTPSLSPCTSKMVSKVVFMLFPRGGWMSKK